MKENEDPEDQLKNLGKEEINSDDIRELYKIPILKARTSSRIGIALVVFPILFLIGVLLENYLNIHGSIFSRLYHWITEEAPDRDDSVVSWIIRFLLVGGPFIVLGINLLSVIHVMKNTARKELIITVKLKWWNLVLAALSGMIILIFIIYGLMENS